MRVGATEDQGLYSKPSAAVHPGALAAGTLPQYNTIPATFRTLKLLGAEPYFGKSADTISYFFLFVFRFFCRECT